MSILSTHNLSVGFKNGGIVTTLLSQINLTLEEGTLTALIGRNGAGKSTLLRAVSGSERPLGGSIIVNGKDLSRLPYSEVARMIALVSTERLMVGALTVREMVELGRQPHTGFMGRLDAKDREVVNRALASTRIMHMSEKMMSQLSDGERQKVMIARALAQETPVIILDEPTAFLDVANRIRTMQLLSQLAHEQGKAVLLSSHDISQTLRLADSLWLVTSDSRVECGTPAEILERGAMDKVFAPGWHIRFNRQLMDYDYEE